MADQSMRGAMTGRLAGSQPIGGVSSNGRLAGSTALGGVEDGSSRASDYDRPWTEDATEMWRQFKGGVLVDATKMAGNALKAVSAQDSPGRKAGEWLVNKSKSQEAEYEPDNVGAGVVARGLATGARGVGGAAPAIAMSTLSAPVAFAGGAAYFGLGSGQEAYEEAKKQGLSEDDAKAVGRRVGLVQGVGEGAMNVLGGRVLKGTPIGKAVDGVAPSFIKEYGKRVGLSVAGNTITEPVQDGSQELIQRSYGMKAEDLGQKLTDSAHGGFWMSAVMAPFGARGAWKASRQQQASDQNGAPPQAPPPAVSEEAILGAVQERQAEVQQRAEEIKAAEAIKAQKAAAVEAAKPPEQRAAEAAAKAEAERQLGVVQRATAAGIPDNFGAHKVYDDLEQARDNGLLTPEEFGRRQAWLMSGKAALVQAARKDVSERVKAKQKMDEQAAAQQEVLDAARQAQEQQKLNDIEAVNKLAAKDKAKREAAAQPTKQQSQMDTNTFIMKLESGGVDTAKNPNSSATGPFQFIDKTWLGLVKQNKLPWADGLSDAEILAKRTDRAASKQVQNLYLQSNARQLQDAGLPVDNYTLYGMHHFGPAVGKKFARAGENVLMDDILTAKQLKSNPYLKGLTKAQAIANWNKRAGAKGGTAYVGSEGGMSVEANAAALVGDVDEDTADTQLPEVPSPLDGEKPAEESDAAAVERSAQALVEASDEAAATPGAPGAPAATKAADVAEQAPIKVEATAPTQIPGTAAAAKAPEAPAAKAQASAMPEPAKAAAITPQEVQDKATETARAVQADVAAKKEAAVQAEAAAQADPAVANRAPKIKVESKKAKQAAADDAEAPTGKVLEPGRKFGTREELLHALVDADLKRDGAKETAKAILSIASSRSKSKQVLGKHTWQYEGPDGAYKTSDIQAAVSEKLGRPVSLKAVQAALLKYHDMADKYESENGTVIDPSAVTEQANVLEANGMPRYIGDYMRGKHGLSRAQVDQAWREAGKNPTLRKELEDEAQKWKDSTAKAKEPERNIKREMEDSGEASYEVDSKAHSSVEAERDDAATINADGEVESDTDTDANINISSSGRGAGGSKATDKRASVTHDPAAEGAIELTDHTAKAIGSEANQSVLEGLWNEISKKHAPIHRRLEWSALSRSAKGAFAAFVQDKKNPVTPEVAYRHTLDINEVDSPSAKLAPKEKSGQDSAAIFEATDPTEAQMMLNDAVERTGATAEDLDALRSHYGLTETGSARVEPALAEKLQAGIVAVGRDGKTLATKGMSQDAKHAISLLALGDTSMVEMDGNHHGGVLSEVFEDFDFDKHEWGQQPLVRHDELTDAQLKEASKAVRLELDPNAPLNERAQRRVYAAIYSALQSPSGALMRLAKGWAATISVTTELGNDVAGAYDPVARATTLHRETLKGKGGVSANATATIIHEYAHAADYAAGLGGKQTATMFPTSPFNTSFKNGQPVMNRAAAELYRLYKDDFGKYLAAFDQAFGDISLVESGAQRPRPVLADRASKEAFARAVEMFNRDPAGFKAAAPITYGIIDSINKAGSLAEVRSILRGTNGKENQANQDASRADAGIRGDKALSGNVESTAGKALQRGAGLVDGPDAGAKRGVQLQHQAGRASNEAESDRRQAASKTGGTRAGLVAGETGRVGEAKQDRLNDGLDFSISPTKGTTRQQDPTAKAVADDLGFDLNNIPLPSRLQSVEGYWNAAWKHKWRNHPESLGILTTDQLAKEFTSVKSMAAYSDANRRMSSRQNEIQHDTGRIAKHWDGLAKKYGAVTDRAYSDMALKATQDEVWVDVPLTDAKNRHLFGKIKPGTPEYAAELKRLEAKHAALYNAFNNLPSDYKALFQMQTDYFSGIVGAIRKAQKSAIIDSFMNETHNAHGLDEATLRSAAEVPRKGRTAFLKAGKFNDLQKGAIRSMWSEIAGMQAQADMAVSKGPYMPLIRFGDHIVVVKSQAFLKAEADLKAALENLAAEKAKVDVNKRLKVDAAVERAEAALKLATTANREDAANDLEVALAAQDKLMAGVRKAEEAAADAKADLDMLKGNERHYAVEFHETLAAAEERKVSLRGIAPQGTTVEAHVKADFFRSLDGASNSYVAKVAKIMADSVDPKQAKVVADIMREVQYQMAPDNSMVKSQLRRLKVAGVKPDELRRAFAKYGQRAAYGISRLEYKHKLDNAITAMRAERTLDASLLANELGLRTQMNMTRVENSLADYLTSLSHMTYLAASPAYVLTNLTQPFLVSMPVMAGRHGVGGTMTTLNKGMADGARVLKVSYMAQPTTGGLMNRSWNFGVDVGAAVEAGAISKEEGDFLNEMEKRGRLEITVAHDLGAISSGATDNAFTRFSEALSVPSRQAEVLNRVGTALAAYRLEYAKAVAAGKGAKAAAAQATDYADLVVEETHFNYAAENTARWMHGNRWGGFGKVAFQFRKYQQHIAYLWASNLKRAIVQGDKESKRTLAYLTATTMAVAGVSGVVGSNIAMMVLQGLYNAFTDDDDEKDVGQAIYMGIRANAGQFVADTVTRGIPAGLGLDLSKRVGHGQIMSLVPFADERKQGGESFADAMFKFFGGASGGMVYNWFEAGKLASEGKVLKAAQKVLPKAFADPLRAYDMASGGIKSSKGTTLVSNDDVGAGAVALKALGFSSTGQGRMWDARIENAKIDERVKKGRDRLVQRAIDDGFGAVAEDIAAFNKRHPGDKITLGVVAQAKRRKAQEERKLHKGIRVTRQNEERLAEDGYLGDGE